MGRSAPLGFDCISKFQAGRTASTLQVQNVWLHNQQPITIINSALSKSLSSAIYYLSAFLTSKCLQVEDRLKTVPRIEILILGCFLSLSFFAAPLRVGNLYWASNFRAHILVSRKMLFTVFHFWAFQPSNLWPRILFISRLLCKNIKRKRTITPHNCEDIFQKCHKVLMLPMHWVDPKCNVMCLQKRYMQIHGAAFCDLDL